MCDDITLVAVSGKKYYVLQVSAQLCKFYSYAVSDGLF